MGSLAILCKLWLHLPYREVFQESLEPISQLQCKFYSQELLCWSQFRALLWWFLCSYSVVHPCFFTAFLHSFQTRLVVHLQVWRHSSPGETPWLSSWGSGVLCHHHSAQSLAASGRSKNGSASGWRTAKDGCSARPHKREVLGHCNWYA